jgi:FKBP-type peptidyl-prolyl cis-trans isomerase
MEDAMKKVFTFMNLIILVFFHSTVSSAQQGIIVMDSGLKYEDLEVGTGATANAGKIAVIHFTGWLDDNGKKGEKIYNSRDRGKPVAFKIGTDSVIKAWNIGVVGMKAGGRRQLMVPSELAYGVKGSGDIIPPHADLIYDIELIEVK